MLSIFFFGLQVAASQPAPPAPLYPEVHYLRVDGAEAGAMKLFASHAERSGAAGRLHPATFATPRFERCSDTPRSRLHRIDTECIRALVPEARDGDPPVVALAVIEDRRSNITGRVVNKSHTIWCIGARSVGFETLNGPLDGVADIGVQRDVDKCIADALSIEREMVSDGEGNRRWVQAFRADRLAEHAQAARGSSDGIATVRVGRLEADPGGRCRVAGTIEAVENGPALRAGDRILLELPEGCSGAHPMLAPLARPGSLIRFYAAWPEGIRFIEPADGEQAAPRACAPLRPEPAEEAGP